MGGLIAMSRIRGTVVAFLWDFILYYFAGCCSLLFLVMAVSLSLYQ